MAEDEVNGQENVSEDATEAKAKEKPPARNIGGNIPYVSSPGPFRKALEGIITAEKPDHFNVNFLDTILSLSGGSARAIPPQLKKMGFLAADGSPTERYMQFRTESGRSRAALAGLKEAFDDLFKRNSYAHREDESGVKDIIVEVTGLTKGDRIVGLMYQTFDAVRQHIGKDVEAEVKLPAQVKDLENSNEPSFRNEEKQIGLSYNINIVIPETDDVAVLNAIFKAVKDNLLQ